MFDFRRKTPFCLKKRISKHNITICSKTFEGAMTPLPPLATPMIALPPIRFRSIAEGQNHRPSETRERFKHS